MYGSERIRDMILARSGGASGELIGSCLRDLTTFRGALPAGDDLTIMAVHRDPVLPLRSH